MPGPRLQRAATVWPERIQPRIRNRIFTLLYNITIYLHYLGEAVDVADIPVMLVVGPGEGRQVARGSDVATRGGGSPEKL